MWRVEESVTHEPHRVLGKLVLSLVSHIYNYRDPLVFKISCAPAIGLVFDLQSIKQTLSLHSVDKILLEYEQFSSTTEKSNSASYVEFFLSLHWLQIIAYEDADSHARAIAAIFKGTEALKR